MRLRSGKRKCLERTSNVEKDQRGVEPMESLPDAVLLLIMEKTKLHHLVSSDLSEFGSKQKNDLECLQFIKSVASINKRFRRLCKTGSLWSSRDFHSKGCMMWILKHVDDFSSACFDETLYVPSLEVFSPREIVTAFDKLGRHLKSISLFGQWQALQCMTEGGKLSNAYVISILKRCRNLTGLEICFSHRIAIGTLIKCIGFLPRLADLSAHCISITEGKDDVTLPLINALSEQCLALKSLNMSSAPYRGPLLIDRNLFKITGLMSLTVWGGLIQPELFGNLSSLTSLHAAHTEIPATLQISCNSVLQHLALMDIRYMDVENQIEIERFTALNCF
mmetsp:Transcript_15511/g.25661  ORF Transcript_15511/g.25661 Transcript_15511/m.25661 type:complete len:335 (-) Transcript_15511:1211-2215(-)